MSFALKTAANNVFNFREDIPFISNDGQKIRAVLDEYLDTGNLDYNTNLGWNDLERNDFLLDLLKAGKDIAISNADESNVDEITEAFNKLIDQNQVKNFAKMELKEQGFDEDSITTKIGVNQFLDGLKDTLMRMLAQNNVSLKAGVKLELAYVDKYITPNLDSDVYVYFERNGEEIKNISEAVVDLPYNFFGENRRLNSEIFYQHNVVSAMNSIFGISKEKSLNYLNLANSGYELKKLHNNRDNHLSQPFSVNENNYNMFWSGWREYQKNNEIEHGYEFQNYLVDVFKGKIEIDPIQNEGIKRFVFNKVIGSSVDSQGFGNNPIEVDEGSPTIKFGDIEVVKGSLEHSLAEYTIGSKGNETPLDRGVLAPVFEPIKYNDQDVRIHSLAEEAYNLVTDSVKADKTEATVGAFYNQLRKAIARRIDEIDKKKSNKKNRNSEINRILSKHFESVSIEQLNNLASSVTSKGNRGESQASFIKSRLEKSKGFIPRSELDKRLDINPIDQLAGNAHAYSSFASGIDFFKRNNQLLIYLNEAYENKNIDEIINTIGLGRDEDLVYKAFADRWGKSKEQFGLKERLWNRPAVAQESFTRMYDSVFSTQYSEGGLLQKHQNDYVDAFIDSSLAFSAFKVSLGSFIYDWTEGGLATFMNSPDFESAIKNTWQSSRRLFKDMPQEELDQLGELINPYTWGKPRSESYLKETGTVDLRTTRTLGANGIVNALDTWGDRYGKGANFGYGASQRIRHVAARGYYVSINRTIREAFKAYKKGDSVALTKDVQLKGKTHLKGALFDTVSDQHAYFDAIERMLNQGKGISQNKTGVTLEDYLSDDFDGDVFFVHDTENLINQGGLLDADDKDFNLYRSSVNSIGNDLLFGDDLGGKAFNKTSYERLLNAYQSFFTRIATVTLPRYLESYANMGNEDRLVDKFFGIYFTAALAGYMTNEILLNAKQTNDQMWEKFKEAPASQFAAHAMDAFVGSGILGRSTFMAGDFADLGLTQSSGLQGANIGSPFKTAGSIVGSYGELANAIKKMTVELGTNGDLTTRGLLRNIFGNKAISKLIDNTPISEWSIYANERN